MKIQTEDRRKMYLEPTYPYAYARVCAMKSKLVRRDDYTKLLKMGVNEVMKFLQETEYKKEIDELSMAISGVNLVELALNKNLIKTMQKLKRISPDELRLLIEAYLKRMDSHNIKTILRGKLTKAGNEYVETLLVPVGKIKKEELLNLMKKESIEEMVKSLRIGIDTADLNDALRSFREKNSLFEIENLLDRHYYNDVLDFVEGIPEEGKLFADFLRYEIDILNIKTMLRLKNEKISGKDIQKHILYSGKFLDKAALNLLVHTEDLNEFISRIKRMGYKKAFGDERKEKESREDIAETETMLYRYLLGKAILLLHQNPLSVDIILGYMFAKEIEVRNLKVLLKGKQLGVEEDFMAKQLVIA